MNKWTRRRRNHRGKTTGGGEKKVGEAELACVKEGMVWIWEVGKQRVDRERWEEER